MTNVIKKTDRRKCVRDFFTVNLYGFIKGKPI